MTAKDISAGVTQVMQGGAFGCPVPKEDLGFPQNAPSLVDTAAAARTARSFALAGLALAIIALVLAGAAWRRRNA
jgi:hypothetical protein